MEPIRILQYGMSSNLAGIENVIMELYRNIDHKKIQFDFLMMNDEDPYFKDEILNYGGRIYKVIYQRGKNPIKGSQWNYNFFREHNEFAAIHCNVSSLLSIDRILTPYVCSKIPQRIIHVHNTGEGKESKAQLRQLEIIRFKLFQIATDLTACSEFAGRYNFVNIPFTIVPNCIKTNEFMFDFHCRKVTREKLKITDKRVIGVVGVLRYQKNHEFLLKIFKEILFRDPSYILLIIGTGQLESTLKKMAVELEIENSIIWTGRQENVLPFYCAMDQYVMPSRYEGFGLVYLEAQCCGLPCVGSKDVVPQETNVSNLMEFIDLSESEAYWADKILSQRILTPEERAEVSKKFNSFHCDVSDYAKKFEKIYLERKAENETITG